MTDMNTETNVPAAPVKAPAKRKVSARADAERARATDNRMAKAKAKAAADKKPAKVVDAWLGSYPALHKWPKSVGAAPTRLHIAAARALNIWRGSTKAELAVAAYCRDNTLE